MSKSDAQPRVEAASTRTGAKVIIASTVMLSFISFWRAAAIVLCDIASSSFYAGGIAERAVGKAAPWFILGIMTFGYAIRAVYLESCGMFVRGGVYRVVHEAMGGTLAKFSVSALMFDYVLTGPISGVSAGLYLAGLVNEFAELSHHPAWKVHPEHFAAVFAAGVTIYFWRGNLRGMHESSTKALRIMQFTTVMVVMLAVWSLITIAMKGYQPIPMPTLANFHFDDKALGWLAGTGATSIWSIAAMIGLGHALLAMSGFETLAQVNREIAHPKVKNLERAGNAIFVYSLVFTTMVSFLAIMMIPDADRAKNYLDNLIGGLAMYMVGPLWARLSFHVFVVIVGTVILAGAVNTSIVGSNGVLNRVAEDGVLPAWFRHPHQKFGTTHRLINTVVALQIFTIAVTRGDLFLLSEAYAFGVVWSFAMKALSVTVLRFKDKSPRQWKTGLNLTIGGVEIPVGLGLITLFLFALAITNLFTKKVATVSGLAFTIGFFIIFEVSERYYKKSRAKAGEKHEELEKFLLDDTADLPQVRPGGVLVPVSNPHVLAHVRMAIEKTDIRRMDVVVLHIKSGQEDLTSAQMFSTDVEKLFSSIVTIAEKAGKHVELMTVQATQPIMAIVETAARIKSSTIVMGQSAKISEDEQAKIFGDAWELLPAPRPQVSLQIVDRGSGGSKFYNLGPHPPRLWPGDIDLLHNLWLRLSELGGGHNVHHRDVVSVALKRLQADIESGKGPDVLNQIH